MPACAERIASLEAAVAALQAEIAEQRGTLRELVRWVMAGLATVTLATGAVVGWLVHLLIERGVV